MINFINKIISINPYAIGVVFGMLSASPAIIFTTHYAMGLGISAEQKELIKERARIEMGCDD